MEFARKVWKLLVAIKDGLTLVLLLAFFMVLYAVLTARPSAGSVREGALLVRLDGTVVEEPATIDPIEQLFASSAPIGEHRARDVVHGLRAAAVDDRIKVVVIDMTTFLGGGAVSMQEIAEAIDVVRGAKKPVLTFATAYTDDALQLAAHASEAWVDPLGGAFVLGPGGNHLYYARLLEKLKVTAHVFRVGTFKSAVEPYLRNDQSSEAKQAAAAMYAALWEIWKADVAKARPKANVALATGDPAAWLRASGGDAAKAAQTAGLVDRIGDEVAFGERVAALAGKDDFDKTPGSFASTSLAVLNAAHPEKTPGKPIGVITIAGEIVDGDAGPGTAGGSRIADALDEALGDDLAALVVRVDSPGGSVYASERIRTAIARYKAKGVPVVVSMGNLAASGGYWVSTPASRIFAEPQTLTGSIGVYAMVPSFERALNDLGVNGDGVKTTRLSGQPDLVTGLSDDVSGMIQANIESTYARFLGLVARSRGKTPAQIDAVAQGRVWAGGDARQLGLVDQFGGLEDALAWAAKAAKLGEGDWHARYLGGGGDPLANYLRSLDRRDSGRIRGQGADLAALASVQQQALVAQALADVRRLGGARGVQALCLECRAVLPAAAPAMDSPRGWLAIVAETLDF